MVNDEPDIAGLLRNEARVAREYEATGRSIAASSELLSRAADEIDQGRQLLAVALELLAGQQINVTKLRRRNPMMAALLAEWAAQNPLAD